MLLEAEQTVRRHAQQADRRSQAAVKLRGLDWSYRATMGLVKHDLGPTFSTTPLCLSQWFIFMFFRWFPLSDKNTLVTFLYLWAHVPHLFQSKYNTVQFLHVPVFKDLYILNMCIHKMTLLLCWLWNIILHILRWCLDFTTNHTEV